ncbi:MAG: hypothetical protein GX660_00660 [Clostridiaceae bacterium]|nr:hypothetical protein [Clostridiaceae bacterium]
MKKSLILMATFFTLLYFIVLVSINVYAADGSIISTIYGDINGDNKVNSTDYIILRRYVLGIINSLPVSNSLEVADVNGDKKITSTDLALYKRYLLGIIDEFPVSSILVPTPVRTTIKSTPIPSANYVEATPTKPQTSIIPSLNALMDRPIQDIQKVFGVHARKDLSKYGFYWYTYNQDYTKYIQVGIQNGKVVGIYSNSQDYKFFNSISVGTSKSKVKEILGSPLQYIQKNDTMYMLDGSGGYEVFNFSNRYFVTVFYDILDESKVTSVLFINREIEISLDGYFGTPSEELSRSYEHQIFDLTNSIRARYGKPLFTWNEVLAKTARNHSMDMALNNYFSTINLNNKSPYQRIKDSGILFTSSSENIGKGHICGIHAFESWMNTTGNKQSILGNYKAAGVGVYIGQGKNILFTEDFCTTK